MVAQQDPYASGQLYTLSCDKCKLHMAADGRMVEQDAALRSTASMLLGMATTLGWNLNTHLCNTCLGESRRVEAAQNRGFDTLEAVNRSLKRPHIKESEAEFPVEVFELGDTDE